MNSKPLKIIFDTDPGVDDAMALYYALSHPKLEVIGVTTVFGNVHSPQAFTNARYLLGLAGRSTVPVAQQEERPPEEPPKQPPAFIHGEDGLGNLPSRLDLPLASAAGRGSAQFIVDMARSQPGVITLVAVGPLSNLAAALAIEPKLPQLLKQVVLMGGTVREPGNVSPTAEANFWNDPAAADAVATAGFDLVMAGLDVTHRVIIPVALVEAVASHHRHPATDALSHAVRFYGNFYSGLYPDIAQQQGGPFCYGHDVLAFIYLTRPELFKVEAGRMRVQTGGLAHGSCLFDWRDIDYPHPGWERHRPKTQVLMAVDAAAAVQEFRDSLLFPWLKA